MINVELRALRCGLQGMDRLVLPDEGFVSFKSSKFSNHYSQIAL